MIAHDRVGVDAYHENLAELLDACFDDGLAMLERLFGIAVDAAEPGAPYASGNAMVGAALARFEEIAARIGHGDDCLAHDGRLGWAAMFVRLFAQGVEPVVGC